MVCIDHLPCFCTTAMPVFIFLSAAAAAHTTAVVYKCAISPGLMDSVTAFSRIFDIFIQRIITKIFGSELFRQRSDH